MALETLLIVFQGELPEAEAEFYKGQEFSKLYTWVIEGSWLCQVWFSCFLKWAVTVFGLCLLADTTAGSPHHHQQIHSLFQSRVQGDT